MKKICVSVLLFLNVAFGFDWGFLGKIAAIDRVRPYVGFGMVSGSDTHTSNQQSMSKEVATCPAQADGTLLCIGDTTRGEYQGNMGNGYNIEIGGEAFFDKLGISGIRVFGEFAAINGGLGNRISGSRDTSVNNLNEAYRICESTKTDSNVNCGILIMGSSTNSSTPNTKVEDSFTFAQTPGTEEQITLPNNGKWVTYGLGIDGFLNIPLDYWLRGYLNFGDGWFAKRLSFLKLGVFFGGGVEFARFAQDSWENLIAGKGKASNKDDAFLAAGSGGFMRYGISLYLTRFARINFGFKHAFYDVTSERWYGFDGMDMNGNVRVDNNWSETLLRQKFVVSKGKEWFLSASFSF